MSEAQSASIEQIRAAWDAVGGQHESVGIDDEITQQYNLVGTAIDELARLREAQQMSLSVLFEHLPADWRWQKQHHLDGMLREFVWQFATEHGRWPTQAELAKECEFIVNYIQHQM